LRQEFCVDQGAQERVTDIALESPQALCLCGGQTEARHLDEFPLDSLEHVIDAHGLIPSSPTVGLAGMQLIDATPVPGHFSPGSEGVCGA
jgi:hypothetical protein